jgi:hypothetical protein
MLSFYFGRDKSFVWAVPKQGMVVFAALNATAGEIQSRVNKLRESLEPQAALISDIPPFDLALAYEIYSLLFEACRGGLEELAKPHRRHEWRIGVVAALAPADRAREGQIGRRSAFLGLHVGALAGAHACSFNDPVIGSAQDASQLAPGQTGPHGADRLRRSRLQR